MHRAFLALALVTVAFAGCASETSDPPALTPEDRPLATLTTNHGEITLQLYADLTPQTVQNFGELAQDGYYDDVKFHRVIRGFMAQGGDPNTKEPESSNNRWGTGGPGYTILDEFPCKDGTVSHQWTGYQSSQEPCQANGGLQVDHDRVGILSMANTGQPRTGGSQFFITLRDTPFLDGTHTVFGHVVAGMDVLRAIGNITTDCTEQGYPPGSNQGGCRDIPVDPVAIQSVTLEGDLPGVEVETFQR